MGHFWPAPGQLPAPPVPEQVRGAARATAKRRDHVPLSDRRRKAAGPQAPEGD